MTKTQAVAERDGWICWICDRPVPRNAASGTADGPTVDHVVARSRGGRAVRANERLAHGRCNRAKRSGTPVLPWADGLSVVDAAPLWPVLTRLTRRYGRELVAVCPDEDAGRAVAGWLTGRVQRALPADWRTEIAPASAATYGVWLCLDAPEPEAGSDRFGSTAARREGGATGRSRRALRGGRR